MNTDNHSEETELVKVEEQENTDNYASIITFNQKLYERIIAKELSLKDPRNFMKRLDDFLTRKVIRHFKLYTTEQPVVIQNLQGNIRLRLLNQEIIGKFLEEIPAKERDLIKYVHLQGIQIAVKACFKEGINSPIILSLHDQRFKNIQNSHLGTLQGNLIYSKLIFECYPNYSVTLRSKNIEDTLNLQFKLLTDIGLQPGNDALSFYYRGLYVFSNTNFPIKEFNKKEKITIDPIFSTVSTIIAPPKQEASIPALMDFQLVDDAEASTSYEAPRLSYTEKGMRIINHPPLPRSLSLTRNPYFNARNLLPAITSNQTYKVKLSYFNGQAWIENKVLIDTGASQSHCIPLPLSVTVAQEYSFTTYDGRQTTLNQKSKIMMKTPTSILLEFDCYIDSTIKNDYYHILLGMNFLDHFTTYDIKPTHITLVQSGRTIILDRI